MIDLLSYIGLKIKVNKTNKHNNKQNRNNNENHKNDTKNNKTNSSALLFLFLVLSYF